MPTWLLQKCAVVLAPYITRIMNASLSTGIFPHSWKQAIVTPLLKTARLDNTTPYNFRPVSNLLERVAHQQISGYLSEHNLFPPFQSAYRKFHSTETAFLKVFSDSRQLAFSTFKGYRATFGYAQNFKGHSTSATSLFGRIICLIVSAVTAEAAVSFCLFNQYTDSAAL